jgi:hypothetical protein
MAMTDLAVVLDGKVESEASDPLRLGSGHNLERLDDTGEGLANAPSRGY